MKNITLDQATFSRLQRHAEALVDSPDSVINRALDSLDRDESISDEHNISTEPIPVYPIHDLPDLAHTKILYASLDGSSIIPVNWNILINRMIALAMGSLRSIEEVQLACPIRLIQGSKTDQGFRYLDELDVSVRGLSANEACNVLITTAHNLGIALDITFMWRSKAAAAFPNEKGRVIMKAMQQDD